MDFTPNSLHSKESVRSALLLETAPLTFPYKILDIRHDTETFYLPLEKKFSLSEFVFVILIPCDSQAKGKRKFTDQRLKLPIFYMMQSIFAGYFQHRLRPANAFPFISKIIKWFKFTGKIGVTHLSHLPIHFSEYYQISAAATFWIGKKQSTFI